MCIQIVINTYNRRKLHVNIANPSYCWIIFAKQSPFSIFFPLDRAKRNKMALKDSSCTVLFLLDMLFPWLKFHSRLSLTYQDGMIERCLLRKILQE